MLPPAKVIPLLQHSDKGVRELALRYLSKAHDPSPATADDVWAVIEKLGPAAGDSFYRSLADMPQTESSLAKTIEALKPLRDYERRKDLESVLAGLSYGLLLRYRDLIDDAPGLSDPLRDHLQKRFELATTPPPELWDRLMTIGQLAPEKNLQEADRLIEALARCPEFAGWAINTLSDASITDMREVHCVDLLGRMRHRQSAPLIADKLASDEDADYLIEASAHALARIGTADVVQLVRERFVTVDWGFRLHFGAVVGRIKLPQSEAALIALLRAENDDTVRGDLAEAMCSLMVTDPAGLEQLDLMVTTGKWDMTMFELDQDVTALFTAIGRPIPKLANNPKPQWAFAAPPVPPAPLDWDDSTDEEIAPMPEVDVVPQPGTIRRAAPKVGRNDPCPCGSGKK
ncbi:MAG TPA: SEC-C metal-binding domain-containing protein, partial [Tepidisphaeraceae bacterium]